MKRVRALAIILTISSSLGNVAVAGPPEESSSTWSSRLPPAAVASYLNASDRNVLVVTAGPETQVLAAAGSALMSAMRESGRFDVVMDASAIGKVGQLSDQEIVGKAVGRPISAVLVVRVFGEGAQASVVGTAYALDGTVISAFSLAPGASLSPRVDQTNAAGVSQEVAGVVSEVMQDGTADGGSGERTAAELEYLERYLHYRYLVQFNVYTGQGTAIRTNAVARGVDNIPMSDVEMLEYIGEPDLARRHQNRKRLKAGLIISGAVLGFAPLVGGAALYGIAASEANNCADALWFSSCQANATAKSAGLGLLVTGGIFTGGFIVGAALPNLLNAKTKMQKISDYNRALRQELLLPDDVEKRLLSSAISHDPRYRRARMLATWRLNSTGMGLSLSGQF